MNSTGRRTTVLAVLVAGVILAACTPASGLPDARQYDLGAKCGQFEVRVGGQNGGLSFVAVRKFGLQAPIPDPYSCRIVSIRLGTGPDDQNITLHECSRFFGTEGCHSYSGGAAGGTWYQLATNDGPLRTARIGLSDIPEEVATRYIEVLP